MTAAGLDLTGPEADELLRPAAELALEMVQAGARMQPPMQVPRGMRPLLGHARLTRAALATARRVLESDAEFRSRVATALGAPGAEATLGRASVLWLDRPEGWEAELADLVGQARSAAASEAEQHGERSAQRRLRHAEEARDRAERDAEESRRTAEVARHELGEERRLHRSAADAEARVNRHAASIEEQLAVTRRRADAAAARLAEQAEAEVAAAATMAALEHDRGRLLAEVSALRAALAQSMTSTPPPEPADSADLAALGEAVAAASAAAVALGAALGRAAGALRPGPPAALDANAPVNDPADVAVARTTRPRWARSQRRGLRRRPATLPPFVLDDSAQAAEHLVSLPNVAVLVDGYNATLSAWPGLALPEQRLRLVDALAELAARTGARPEVVFDGADMEPGAQARVSARSLVRVVFTAADVEADDVIIARAHALPLPVLVASNDHRVREGGRSAGANVIGIEQLLTILRRQATSP